jgi:hypothetical protein
MIGNRSYVKVYIDDYIIFSGKFEEQLRYLDKFFTTLVDRNITLKPKKAYVGFPDIRLLSQHVNGLGLATLQERVKAIKNIREPTDAQQLDKFLGITGYLRSKIPWYSQLAEPLQ